MTAQTIFPLAQWLEGTNQNATPANDNTLRMQAAIQPAINFAATAPSSPAAFDQYVVSASWGSHTVDSVVIWDGVTWHEFAPFANMRKVINGLPKIYTGSAWASDSSSGGTSDPPPYNRKTASYSVVVADAPLSSLNQGIIGMDVAGANNLTIDPHSSQAWGDQTMLQVIQLGAGQVTVVAGSGVTINSASTLKTRAQYSTLLLTYLGSDTWILSGDMQ